MKVENVHIIKAAQGSLEWLAHRAARFNASDAPAMIGISTYKTRSELLREMATGITVEVDAGTQARFNAGHVCEAVAREWAEEIIGESLYPVVLAGDVDGMPLGASYDGLSMDDSVVYEHKSANRDLSASLSNGDIPTKYWPQLEQQLLLSGAEKALFCCSNGTRESFRHAWYYSKPEQRERLIAGWKQFATELAEYSVDAVATASPVGRSPETLPALRIEVTGMVTASNLEAFRDHALAVVNGINRDLQTDQDFADAEKAIKFCADVESRIKAAKEHALSQTASIEELFRTMDGIGAEYRATRLELDKIVKARKDGIRTEIQQGAVNALREHYNAINATFAGRLSLPMPAGFGPDVGAAMKGKKTIASLRDAADTTLANGKIEANATADRVRLNLAEIDKHAERASLFPDVAALAIGKATDDLCAIITARIADHETKERLQLEAERERIRAEEQEKAAAEVARGASKAVVFASDDAVSTAGGTAQSAQTGGAARSEQHRADIIESVGIYNQRQALAAWAKRHHVGEDAMAELREILARREAA